MEILRLAKVLTKMEESNIPQMIISDPASIFYLTGKWIHPGKRMLALYLNTRGNHKLFINELFPVSEDLGVEKVWFKDTDEPIQLLSGYVDKDKPMGIDKNWPAKFLLRLMELGGGSSFINSSPIIDQIRMSKDAKEIPLMEEASKINDQAMERMVNLILNKYTEKHLSQLLPGIYEDLGGEGPSFDPIVAYGANCANPHHEPDYFQLKEGDSIILDIGCKKASYCADMTRTVFYKSVSDKAREVYHIVKDANERAIAAVKPGVRFCDIDHAARSYIEEKGYGQFFTHRTGHSIGIEVHDFGDVSSINTDLLTPGMIFSIEPGIYLPGEFGVRIEDLVLVTEDGCKVLNSYPKDLIVIE
ncbi:MAG: proline dipeptidase [Anaerosolibacter sp.]|uniref:M24 family metallopeptidase n=1 Tax=Anaerosolibacter sp. TaxID=1872527 RepID=UPI002616C0A8|nr:aminopeptidase P family protein [Anaerosolibacter sp.]MDF2547589.1 proline dipeptidase [Anaerosolibacter sp.]